MTGTMAASTAHEASLEAVRVMLCSTASVKPIKIKSWLIDRGAPLDLIDKSAVKRYAQFVQGCEPALLDTANSEVTADRQITL